MDDFNSDSEDESEEFPKTNECELFKIKSRIKEDNRLVRLAEKAAKSQKGQRGLNSLIEQLCLGNEDPGIGNNPLCKNVIEARAFGGGWVYFRKKGQTIEILGKSGKEKKNQDAVIKILKQKYE